LPIFEPKKCYNPLSPYSPGVSLPDYFLFPKLKVKVKGFHFVDVAEIQEAVTNELKKVQNINFRQLFRNCTTAQKPAYMAVELILNLKKKLCPCVFFRFLKKSVQKHLDRTVYTSFYLL
jgi:hypothetical protein